MKSPGIIYIGADLGVKVENKGIGEFLDQQRWLMNNGFMSDALKNQLFFCGSIVHKDVKAVEVEVVAEKKSVAYKIYVPSSIFKKINRFKDLEKSTDLFNLWRFKRLLKKEGNLNFSSILNSFIKDYCGPKWSAVVEVYEYESYSDGAISEADSGGWDFNQKPDPR